MHASALPSAITRCNKPGEMQHLPSCTCVSVTSTIVLTSQIYRSLSKTWPQTVGHNTEITEFLHWVLDVRKARCSWVCVNNEVDSCWWSNRPMMIGCVCVSISKVYGLNRKGFYTCVCVHKHSKWFFIYLFVYLNSHHAPGCVGASKHMGAIDICFFF